MRVAHLPRARRRRRARLRLLAQWSVVVVVLFLLAGLALGLAFAGSPERLPEGTRIAGVDVAGLTPGEARAMLERRMERQEDIPVTFLVGDRSWRVKPAAIIDETDWAAAVQSAQSKGEGFGPVRGLRRLGTRVFGTEVMPRTRVRTAALDYELDRFAAGVDRPRREPSLRLQGLSPTIVPGRTGRVLDREAAARVAVASLVGFVRDPVALPVRVEAPRTSASDLSAAKARVRTILSAPVQLAYGPGGWKLARWKLATMLRLPQDGSSAIRIGGPGAERFFAGLSKSVDRPAQDASFAIGANNSVSVIPARSGVVVDEKATSRAIIAAALTPGDRVARVQLRHQAPAVTTRQAQGMGITGLVGAYETTYGGEENRLHNVRLVASLIDGALIAPGSTFSFNGTTGERGEDKGFREAPVIINGELQTGIGGGVCQVSTTVFNAAYEAGLPITARTNHALYISHYPQGRDATVNYPDTDLKFRNDTSKWLLLRTFVGSSSLTVALYGAPQDRRVESEVAPLVVTGDTPVKRVSDPSLFVGQTSLQESGSPPRQTSVRRKVYTAGGKLLYDDEWSSWYRGEYRVINVGTKERPKSPPLKKKPAGKKAPPPPPPPTEPPAPPSPPLP
ncbi:MAG TPA: VanW family protein [Gaiellaceae bacterium]|nr:VanW family protein [Gaiellaceae bacterium]